MSDDFDQYEDTEHIEKALKKLKDRDEQSATFDRWWNEEGSGLPPRESEDHHEHVRRICKIAWSNGEYTTKQFDVLNALRQLTEACEHAAKHGESLALKVKRQNARKLLNGLKED